MTTPLLLGIDIGTTNIKAIVFDPQGQLVSSASVKTPTYYPRPNWAYNDPNELWQETVRAIRQAVSQLENPAAIVGVAVASMGEAAVPVDAHGQPTYDSIAWFDTRTEPQARWLDQHVGRDKLFYASGLSLQPIFGLCKVLWLREHEPAAFARTRLWLNMADYIAFRLSGKAVTEYSLGSRILALNVHRLCWDEEILAAVDLPASLFGELAGSGVGIGTILPEVAAATGLPTSCVVATGGQDHVCGALAVGVNQPGSMLDSLGTAEASFAPIAKPLDDPQTGLCGYGQGCHVAGGYYMLGGMYTSSACIEWFRNTFAPDADYASLIQQAEQAPVGSLGATFMPHLRLANPPITDPKSRGVFIGLSTDATRGTLFRALLEGLAYEFRNGMEPMLRFIGQNQMDQLYAIGGGTRNRLLMQIKANVLNQTIQVVSMDEATALGAAVLGGLGAGVYKDVADAVGQLRYTLTPVVPQAEEAARYDRLFKEVYVNLYPAVRALHHTVYGLVNTPV